MLVVFLNKTNIKCKHANEHYNSNWSVWLIVLDNGDGSKKRRRSWITLVLATWKEKAPRDVIISFLIKMIGYKLLQGEMIIWIMLCALRAHVFLCSRTAFLFLLCPYRCLYHLNQILLSSARCPDLVIWRPLLFFVDSVVLQALFITF